MTTTGCSNSNTNSTAAAAAAAAATAAAATAAAALLPADLRAQAEEARAGAVHTGRHQPRLDPALP